jgi:hypothetical protein
MAWSCPTIKYKPRGVLFLLGLSNVVFAACNNGSSSSSSSGTATSTASTTTEETAAVANSTVFDCQGVGPLVNCLSGFIATQGFTLIEVNAQDGRSPTGEPQRFVDAADFGDRFVTASVIPSIDAYFKSQDQTFDVSAWTISLSPEVTRTNFGTSFTVDLQGPVSVTADIKNTGKFQITHLHSGTYSLRLYKELTLTYKNMTSGDSHTDCVVLENLRDVRLDDGTRHQELGAISDLTFYVRAGKACDGNKDGITIPTSAEVATADEDAPANSASTGGGTADENTTDAGSASPTDTATSSTTGSITQATVAQPSPQPSPAPQPAPPPPPPPPLLTFSGVLHTFCSSESLLTYLPNAATDANPWFITKAGRDIRVQQADRNDQHLPLLASPITVNGPGNSCVNTSLDARFVAAAGATDLLVTWNCTGDGTNRYWRGIVAPDGSFSSANQFIGGTISYQMCSYAHDIPSYKCGSDLLNQSQSVTLTSLPSIASAGLNQEIPVSGGYATVSGSALTIYTQATNSVCSVTLAGTGMGLVEAADGTIYTYNGRVVESVDRSSCAVTNLGNVRAGSNDAYFLTAPTLVITEGNIVAGGLLTNVLQFEKVTLGPPVAVGSIMSVGLAAADGLIGLVRTTAGTRFLTNILNGSGCREIRTSGVLLP